METEFQMSPSQRKYDVAIIGGGPAGLSAALWSSDLGLRSVLIEQNDDLGGQLSLINNAIKNFPGVETSNGREMAGRFIDSLQDRDFTRLIGIAVERIDLDRKAITMADGNSITFGSLVIATGVRRRMLNVPGEIDFVGKGTLVSGVGEAVKLAGKRVVIVGGGDAAIENALILCEVASSVTVVHRRAGFSARRYFIDEAARRSNIEFTMETSILSINGGEFLESVTAHAAGTDSRIATDFLLIRIGVIPNSELVAGLVALDERSYIMVDARGETSSPGVFAVGDVANPLSPTIATAVGTAATSIKTIAARITQ